MNHRINTLHQKALRLVYTNKPDLSFDDLLKEDISVKIRLKNLQTLVTEIYKVKNDLGPKTMADIFHFVEKPYNLRNNSTRSPGDISVCFSIVTVNDEYRKPESKIKRRG